MKSYYIIQYSLPNSGSALKYLSVSSPDISSYDKACATRFTTVAEAVKAYAHRAASLREKDSNFAILRVDEVIEMKETVVG